MIRINPEFDKNLKLEFSLARVAIPAILLLLMSWIGWSSVQEVRSWETQYSLTQLKAETLFRWLCGFGFFFTVIWGTYLTANSLLEEMKLKSWDFVRMSSLSPLKILTGKMFGAPSVVWTVSLFGAMPLLLYAAATMIPDGGVVRPAAETVASLGITLLAWTILSYALSFLLGLSAAGTARGGAFGVTSLIFLMGTWIGGMITATFENFHQVLLYGQIPLIGQLGKFRAAPLPPNALVIQPGVSYLPKPIMTDWYGLSFYGLDIVCLLLVFFAGWAFIGAWRALRKSLQYRDPPWAWIGFIVTASILLNGFQVTQLGTFSFIRNIFHWPIMVGLITMVFACAREAGDVINYKSCARKLAAGAYFDAFRDMPLWMLSFAAFLVSVLLSAAMSVHTDAALAFLLSLTGFVIRDLLAFHVISWMPNVRRPLVGMILYCAVVYGLLPTLATTAGNPLAGLLFFPLARPDLVSGIYWIILAVEIVAAGFFLANRARGILAPSTASIGSETESVR